MVKWMCTRGLCNKSVFHVFHVFRGLVNLRNLDAESYLELVDKDMKDKSTSLLSVVYVVRLSEQGTTYQDTL